MQKHFNPSLSPSPAEKWRIAVQVKKLARIRINSFCDGGSPVYVGSADAIVIRRVDVLKVHDYARTSCDLRDYLLVRLPLKIGLRTGELCTLRIEDVNFGDRSFSVVDSKRKRAYPLPLDPVSLDLLKDLAGTRLEGYVFQQKCSWMHAKHGKPLTVSTVWIRVRNLARQAGVEGFNPRRLRQFFRRILRHKSLAYTQLYLSRLIFWEDLQAEYERFQDGPFLGGVKPSPVQAGVTEPLLNSVCTHCEKLSVCKFADQMPSWATGCRFQTLNTKEENKHPT
jgi:hypothetical protein